MTTASSICLQLPCPRTIRPGCTAARGCEGSRRWPKACGRVVSGWGHSTAAPLRRGGLVARAEEARTSNRESDDGISKACNLASQRLESLLAGAGDGEDELVSMAMREVAPAKKTAAYCLAGGVVGSVATFVCYLLHLDPYGGMSLSMDSVRAALFGATLALPVMAIQYMKWSPVLTQRFPALNAIRAREEKEEGSLYAGMTDPQLVGITVTGSAVTCVCELAFLQEGLQTIVTDILGTWGVSTTETLPVIAALVLGSAGRGLLGEANYAIDPEEREVLRNALSNCDRYYDVMGTDKDKAHDMAIAFKAVVYVYLRDNMSTKTWAFWTSAAQMAYLIFLWRTTGNLAAPIVALSMATSVDIREYKKRHPFDFEEQQ